MKEEILRMENVTCQRDGIISLDNVNLNIFKGEIFGLIPINIQGKSELIKLLCHDYSIDYGRVYLNNELINYYERSIYSLNRVFVIEPKSKLIQDLTVSDNIFVLRSGFKKYIINRKVLNKQVDMFLQELNISINPNELVKNLNPFDQFLVELLKAIILGANLIIINDISNILSIVSLSKVQELMNFYVKKGFTFLYIANHHEEVFKICNRVALLKDGSIVKVFDDELTDEKMKAYVTSFEDVKINNDIKVGNGILELVDISTKNMNKISFSIESGECLVLFDTNNMIFDDLLKLINGEPAKSGVVLWEQKPLNKKIRRNPLSNGIVVIVENATENMLFKNLSYVENLYFLVEQKLKTYNQKSKVLKSIIKEYGDVLGEEIYEKDITKLELTSLYNLVYYRIHIFKPKLVFCVQPFSGADMYLRMHIMNLIRQLKEKGITVIILAVNISDTLSIADRFLVIEEGTIVNEFYKEDFNSISY